MPGCVNNKSFAEIGEALGISKQRAEQIYAAALRKIRTRMLPILRELEPDLAREIETHSFKAKPSTVKAKKRYYHEHRDILVKKQRERRQQKRLAKLDSKMD